MQVLVNLGATTLVHCTASDRTFSQLAAEISSPEDVETLRHDVWFQHAGRRCPAGGTLAEAGVYDGDVVYAHLRLRGGGGDGGATGAESRSSYLEMYMQKKPDKVNPAEEKLARATLCKLSGQRLEPPCVVDELGSLYNKEAIVSALVSKTMPKALGHISSLKHVREARLTRVDGAAVDGVAFCCPVSDQPLNGQYKFCALFPTGHIVSDKAATQVAAAVEELLGGPWLERIPLNGSAEEVEVLWDRLIIRRAAAKQSKKDRKRAIGIDASAGNAGDDVPEVDAPSAKRPALAVAPAVATAKRPRAAEMVPANADKKVWASLFTSTHGGSAKETYGCRSTSARGWM